MRLDKLSDKNPDHHTSNGMRRWDFKSKIIPQSKGLKAKVMNSHCDETFTSSRQRRLFQ